MDAMSSNSKQKESKQPFEQQLSYISEYTGCPRRNVKYFGRVFLMLNYTDITQNTYIQSWTFTELMAIKSVGFCGVHELYAVRDVIFIHCASPARGYRNVVTLAKAS